MSNSISSFVSGRQNAASSLVNEATNVAKSLTSAEDKYTSALKSGDKSAIVEAQVEYQNQQENFEALIQMLKNKYETMIRVIRNMSVS